MIRRIALILVVSLLAPIAGCHHRHHYDHDRDGYYDRDRRDHDDNDMRHPDDRDMRH